MERFINLEKNSNNNLLIKTAMFTILFYILTSKKSSELIKNILGKMSKNNYSLIMILIFSVFYYIINTLI